MVYGDNFACSFTITHSGWGSQVYNIGCSKHPDGFTLHKRVAFLFISCLQLGEEEKKKRLKSSKQRMGLIQMSKISMELHMHR